MDKEDVVKIGVGMTIAYVLLYLQLLPPTLWMYGSYGFAAAIVFLTFIVLGNTTCGGSRRFSLFAAAAGLGAYFCAFAYLSSTLHAGPGMDDVMGAAVLLGIAFIVGIVACALAILSSCHIIVYVALVAGYFIANTIVETKYGLLLSLVQTVLAVFKVPVDPFSFMMLATSISVAGFVAWLFSLYMICEDEEEKREEEEKRRKEREERRIEVIKESEERYKTIHTHTLKLVGNKGSITIDAKDTPYVLTPQRYASLSNDTDALDINPYEIQGYVNTTSHHCKWSLRNLSAIGTVKVYLNREFVPYGSNLADQDIIYVEQRTIKPEVKSKSKTRTVLALKMTGDKGKMVVSPLVRSTTVGRDEYTKLCSDDESVPMALYILAPDAMKTGSMWFIAPVPDSGWEVLVNGEPISVKVRLSVNSTISLRRKGTSEEVYSIHIQGVFRQAVSKGKVIQPREVITKDMGRVSVSIEHKEERVRVPA